MPLFGKIIVIKRNGTDGIHFPLTASSCLFGRLNCLQDLNSFIQLRRTECDIRIQLPQVSKEHCKIEVNENEEAILTNLSTVNPTQLNGSCFQQPVPLKHGDVLTIIDRSFRFEYPLQSTPRKRRSRSLKDETRQVAEVELLHKQTSGSKRSSDHSECKEQNADENKQSTEENMSKALPVKLQTPKSSYKTKQSIKKENEMSPFSRLYETLKHEIKVKKTLQEGNVPEKAETEGGKGALQEPSARLASSCDLVSPAKEKEIGISENNEEYKMKQEVISSEFNQISTVGSATKKCFTRSPQTSVSKEMTKGTGKRSNLQDHKEVSTPRKSKGTEVTAKTPKPNKENDSNAARSLQPCSIERLGYVEKVKIYNSAITAEKIAQTTNMTNVSEVGKQVSTPTPRRKSPRSCFTSPTKEATGVDSVNIGTPTTRGGVSLERKSFSEISAEIQREDTVCRNDSLQQLPLAENKCLKQRRNSKQHTPRKSARVEVLKEICDQTNVDSKKRDSESPASNSKSPRRNVRQSKEFVNKSVHSETPTSGELKSELASPASEKSGSGRKRGRQRTSELLRTEKASETNAVKEHHNKTVDSQDSGTQQDLATNGCNQKSDLENASVPRPHRFSSRRRSSGSANVLEGNEAVSEMSVSGLLAEEESGKTKIASQKRKSGDLLPQPLGKRKRVSFGGHLSPELFDKSLPPNSPLKRGAIPARLSLPFGDTPRAVLKKAQGLKHFAVQELSVRLQKEKMSPENLPAQTPPAASSPDSGKATPELTTSSPAPYTKGRFSVSLITTPSPIAEEQNGVEKDMNTEEKSGDQVQTPTSNHVSQDDNALMATPNKLTKSSQRSSKKTPMKRRSGAVAVINAKRRSGASTANLLVAKSWAEVVKLGVARPQAKAVKKRTQKGRPAKKITESPKTPERKIKGHFSTGHAESPATIVVGRAYSTTIRTAGQVPKVVKNPILKQNLNMDESFTGLGEMFKTPENMSGKRSPSSPVHNSDFTPTCTAVDVSELHTPEESGEMMVSPLNTPDASEQKLDCQDISYLLGEKESPKSVFEIISTKTPEGRQAVLEEDLDVDSVSIIAEKQASQVKLASKRKTPDQKLESVEVVSGIKQLLRTPKKKPEPAEVLSGIKRLMETPKQKPEPAEAQSGIKRRMKTPKQKPELAEVLSGIKQLMKTPKQKPEPAEALSGIKRRLKTPKQKPELAEVLSGIKQLMKTPKQKPEPAEALSGIKRRMKTPKQKPELAEVLSGIKRLMKTPKQTPEPAEALSGIKQLVETPKQKPELAEVLSGIKQLMETLKQSPEPAEAQSGIKQLMETPKQKPELAEVLSCIKRLMETPKQSPEPAEAQSGIKQLVETPKQKPELAEVLSGIKRLMETPKQTPEPAEAQSGIKQLVETPKQKPELAEVLSGIKRLMETPKQTPEPAEALSGIKQLVETPKQKPELAEVLSCIKRLMETPKQTPEPAEALSGIKQLVETPKQKPELAEVLSCIKQLMETPKQTPEPAEALSGIKQLVETPKQKPELAEVLSCIKRLMETPKQTPEPAEALSGIKQLVETPKQKPELAEVLSGIKQLMETLKQTPEPAEALSGIKQLMETPKQKPEPAEALSGIKQLTETPKQKPEPVEVLSGIKQLMETPEEKLEPAEVLPGIKQVVETPQQKLEPITDENTVQKLLKTPVQKKEVVEDVTGVNLIPKNPKLEHQPVEDMVGVSRIFKTPKEKVEPIEDMFGISRLVQTPREKYHPVDDFVGLKRLMAEPRQKNSDSELDYAGVKEMFGEETKVRSENVMDPKQEDAVPPCANDSRDYGGNKTVLEDPGNTSQGKDSQQDLSTSEDHSTQRLTRGRSRKIAHPTSIKQCEKDLNLKELQGLEKKSIQEEMGEISTSTSIAKNRGRRKRTNPCMEEEIVSKHPDEKTVETVSLVETQVDTQRPRRGKTKEPKELKHPSEDLESCEKDSSVLQKDPANRKQTLQEYDINDTSVTEDDQSRKTEIVSSSSQDENYQLQTDFKKSENTSDKGSVEDREEIPLLHQKRSRRMKKIENTEALLPPKRGRRARNEQAEQASSEELHGTTRKLRKDQSAKLLQGDEWTSETAPTEESENRTKLEVKITEKRGKSSRNARKHPTEVKADVCGMALENTQNVQKAKETSNETVTETQSPTKNERKVSLGDEAENAQENTTKSSLRLKSESPSGETDKMPITVLNLEANKSSVQEANRTRSRRGRKDSSEKKADEFAQDVKSLDLMPKCRSETGESSPKESSASSCVKQSHQVMKDQNNTADPSVTTLNSDSVAQSRQKRTRNEQEANEPKQTEILQENQTQNNRTTHRRVRGRKVNFKLEEASSEALGEERNLPGNEEGMTCKRDQHEASENPVQVRRSKRRRIDSIPQATCSTFTKKETLIKDHSKDETCAKDQDPALEAIPSSTEEVPLRGRTRRGVAVASQTVSSISIRKKRGLLEGDDKKMTVKEDQSPALGNNALQAKANASARDERKEIDLAAEAKSSASLRRKRGLSETDDKEESTNEEQNMLLESVSCAKEKPLGRGRRKETPPVSHTTNSISLRRKRGLPADNGREEAPKDQNVPEDEPKRGRRNEAAILLEATSSTSAQGKRNLSKESSRKNNRREAKKMISEKPSSEEKIDLSKGYSGKKISITSLADSSSSLQGLPEDGENETPEEQQGILLEVTQSAKENPSKAGRRKIVPSKSEETSSTFLREKPVLPEDRAQKGVLEEGEGTALENNSSQETHRQLRNKRKNVQFKSEAATSTSLHDNGSLPENGNILETQCLISTGSEENNQSGKGKEVNPTQQTTSTSRRRKCLFPADDLPPKKLKSENNENRSPKKGKRNKTEEKLEGDVKTTQTAGGTNRTTRSSTRASARTRK
ncbi:proliferation marker protein Ki-67 isoform X3 [Anser cygnoides]|uniref:proliferation marker protein Ki-67 isoform X3 n=1 Tax=Anser cygnoides TaxID=8845 RepID=UPI0034D2D2AA